MGIALASQDRLAFEHLAKHTSNVVVSKRAMISRDEDTHPTPHTSIAVVYWRS